MKVRYWPKSELAKTYGSTRGLLAELEREAQVKAAEVAATQDPYGSEERNRRAARDARAKAEAHFTPKLAELFQAYERARGAAPLHSRAAYLRKAALDASSGRVAILAAMPVGVFATTMIEAAARNDATTVGAGLALGRSIPDGYLHRVGEAVNAVELPEQAEAMAQLTAIRDAFLKARVLVRGVTHPDEAAREALGLGHELAAPLVEE